MDLMLDVFIAFCGGYLVYSAMDMKKTGSLKQGVMVRKDADLSKAKDIPGFIAYMYMKTIVVGICTLICGIVGIVNDIYGGFGMVQLVMTFVFFFAIVIFGIMTAKAQKKFLGI